MAVYPLTDSRVFVGGYDLSGDHNRLTLALTFEALDVTGFNSGGYRKRIAGLGDVELSGSGFWEAGSGEPDTVLFPLLGTTEVMSVLPKDATDGERGYAMQAVAITYEMGAAVGEVMPFTLAARGKTTVAQGMILHPPDTARTVSGNGTARQLGAGTGKRVYAGLHVIAASGTLDVKVQTDNASGFLSPTDLITFTQATTVGAQFLSAAGNADDWYRVVYTIGGGGPSFKFLAVVGVK